MIFNWQEKMPSKAPASEAETLSSVSDAEVRPQRRHFSLTKERFQNMRRRKSLQLKFSEQLQSIAYQIAKNMETYKKYNSKISLQKPTCTKNNFTFFYWKTKV